MKQHRASKRSAIRRGSRFTACWCGPEIRGYPSANSRPGYQFRRPPFPIIFKTLIIVGLVTQERDVTTLICRANYSMMRGLVGFLVAECCTEADCATIRQQAETAA